MKRKMIILLAISFIASVSAMAFISDVPTDTVRINAPQDLNKNDEKKNEDEIETVSKSWPKSKLTLMILFLGGVGLAVFRRNSLV